MLPTPDLDLKALAALAGVTPRTVHFYIQQGVLPPAGSQGPGARYTEGHLLRLRLVKLLQREHLPLAEIARRLRALSDRQVAALLSEGEQRQAAKGGSALEYIRGVLGQAESGAGAPLRSATHPRTATPLPEAERSRWDRYMLADGVELHVRRPLSRDEQRRLDDLLATARAIFADKP